MKSGSGFIPVQGRVCRRPGLHGGDQLLVHVDILLFPVSSPRQEEQRKYHAENHLPLEVPVPVRRPVQNRLKIRDAEIKITVALVRARVLRLLQQRLHLGGLLRRLRVHVIDAFRGAGHGSHRLIKVAVRFSVGAVALRETLHLADIERQISAAPRLVHFHRGIV